MFYRVGKMLLAYSFVSHFSCLMQWCHICKFKTRWKQRRFNGTTNISDNRKSANSRKSAYTSRFFLINFVGR